MYKIKQNKKSLSVYFPFYRRSQEAEKQLAKFKEEVVRLRKENEKLKLGGKLTRDNRKEIPYVSYLSKIHKSFCYSV